MRRNPKGSDIPKARTILENMAADLVRLGGHDGFVTTIAHAISLMTRAKPVGGTAKPTHRGWGDPTLKGDLAATVAAHPHWTRQQVSIACNTNTARVSEFKAGIAP